MPVSLTLKQFYEVYWTILFRVFHCNHFILGKLYSQFQILLVWSILGNIPLNLTSGLRQLLESHFSTFFTKLHSWAFKVSFKGPDLGHRLGQRGRSLDFSRHETFRGSVYGGHYFQNECLEERVSPWPISKWGVL